MLNKKNLIFYSLITFGVYCSIKIGVSYDEFFHYDNGERRLKYLLSFGKYDYYDILHLRYYPGLYDTLSYFINLIFPQQYRIEIFHLTNFITTLTGVIALTKVVKIFFSKNISYIFFVLTFLNPIFFGHMSFNSKDNIIATANFWCLYYILRYLKTPSLSNKALISTKLGLFIGLGVGIRVVFLGTLIPYILFFFLDVFLFKKFCKNFLFKLFFLHLTKAIFIAYFVVILCWPNVHGNIFIEPFILIKNSLNDLTQGVQWSVFDGIFYETKLTPWFYLFVNFFYKLPIYLIFLFISSFIFFLKMDNFYNKIYSDFIYKFIIILFFILIPIFISIINNLKIHDGLRYFLYLLPLLNISSALFLYYIYKNKFIFINKIFIVSTCFFFIFFIINFIKITPYHYTHMNFLYKINPSKSTFEHDYWGASLKELIYDFSKSKNLINNPKIAVCGVNHHVVDFYLKKYGLSNYQKTDIFKKFDYAILINRTLNPADFNEEIFIPSTCFEKLQNHKTILNVNKNSLILSKIIEY
jgi:hypothetical protein